MDDISKLKIELFDLQERHKSLLFEAKELVRLVKAKREQLRKLESSSLDSKVK